MFELETFKPTLNSFQLSKHLQLSANMAFLIVNIIAIFTIVSSNKFTPNRNHNQDVCMLYDTFGLSSSSNCNANIDYHHAQIWNPLSVMNQEQTLSQYIIGLIIHQAVYLTHTMENTYYRIRYISHSNENILTVLYEESCIYLRMFLYCCLAFALSLWTGFILGWIVGYCFSK